LGVTADSTRIFSSIVDRESSWRRLSTSALSVIAVYAFALSGAVVATRKPITPPRKLRTDLVVTLFEAPKISEIRSLGEAGGEASVVMGTAEAAGPVVSGPEERVARPTPKPKSKPEAKAKALPQEKENAPAGAGVQPTPPAPTPTPTTGEDTNTSSTQLTASAGTNAGGGQPGTSSGGAPGGTGGAGTGSNSGSSGAGSGTGIGTRPGMVSGDTTVMPFMDGMTRPSLVTQTEIEFTREARDANVSGSFILKCVIQTNGSLQRCKIVKGNPLMDQQVLSAVAKWRYTPVIYQGKAVPVEYVIPIRLK
jgi:protein TonB